MQATPPVSSESPNTSQTPIFCTECYYKPGICRNEPGSPVRHLGTPLASSPPSNSLLESINSNNAPNSLARTLAQQHEEMKYLSLEVMNKSLRGHDSPMVSPKSTSSKHVEESLTETANLRPEFHII